jgi:hypothetical protein
LNMGPVSLANILCFALLFCHAPLLSGLFLVLGVLPCPARRPS